MHRRKICFLTRSLEIGGAERQLALLANLMQADGYDVKIVCMYGSKPLGEDVHRDVELIALNKSGRWDVFRFLRRCYREIKDFNPDYLYSFLVIPNILSVLMSPFLRNCKIVWGIRASNMDLSKYDLFTQFTYKVCAVLSRFADIRISNSIAGARHAIETGFYEPIEFVPNGVDLNKFHVNPELRTKVRKELNIHDDIVVLGCVARLDVVKGYEFLLKAFHLMIEDIPNLRLYCVGSGDPTYSEDLKELTKILGLTNHVAWLPSFYEMCGFYNAIDLFVSSSRSEGFSNVIVESLACGTLAVATDVGDSHAIIKDKNLISIGLDEISLKNTLVNGLGKIHGNRNEVRKQALCYGTDMLKCNTEAVLTKSFLD